MSKDRRSRARGGKCAMGAVVQSVRMGGQGRPDFMFDSRPATDVRRTVSALSCGGEKLGSTRQVFQAINPSETEMKPAALLTMGAEPATRAYGMDCMALLEECEETLPGARQTIGTAWSCHRIGEHAERTRLHSAETGAR